MAEFYLDSTYKPKGDQPKAIEELVNGVLGKESYQTLLGVTGSGKTFTIAKSGFYLVEVSFISKVFKNIFLEIRDENAINYNIFKLKLFDSPEINTAIGVVRIVLTIPILYLTIKFFTKDVFQLATIKH